MSNRIVMVDYVVPLRHADGDQCTGCPRLNRLIGYCHHFGALGLKNGTKSTYYRHPNCIRAEERTNHASTSALMFRSDFLPEEHAKFDKEK